MAAPLLSHHGWSDSGSDWDEEEESPPRQLTWEELKRSPEFRLELSSIQKLPNLQPYFDQLKETAPEKLALIEANLQARVPMREVRVRAPTICWPIPRGRRTSWCSSSFRTQHLPRRWLP